MRSLNSSRGLKDERCKPLIHVRGRFGYKPIINNGMHVMLRMNIVKTRVRTWPIDGWGVPKICDKALSFVGAVGIGLDFLNASLVAGNVRRP